MKTKFLTPNEAKKHDIKIAMDGVKRSCLEVMGQRKVNMAKIRQIFTDIPVFQSCNRKASCNRCSLHGIFKETRARHKIF